MPFYNLTKQKMDERYVRKMVQKEQVVWGGIVWVFFFPSQYLEFSHVPATTILIIESLQSPNCPDVLILCYC